MSARSGRRPTASIVASPVLVGAVTVLVVLVAVFLSYNANNGLPFVPTRELKIDFPSGNELVKGNEVREGGDRIGVVTKIKPVRLPNGSVVAQADLHLDKKAGAFPVDTVATIRPRSVLGLEYVQLQKGQSKEMIPDGGTLAASNVQTEVELDQVLGTFDRPTRDAIRTDLYEYGDAFAARGPDLNTTIQLLPRTFGYLRPVMTNLSSRFTNLPNFFPQQDITVDTIAPVSQTFAHSFTTMADTFAAIDRSPSDLQATIAKGPSTEQVGTVSLKAQLPYLKDQATLGRYLSPAAVQLRQALPTLNSALVIGTRVTKRTPVLYGHLQEAMDALRNLAQTPTTNAALRGLTATLTTLQPTLRYLGPYVTVCNYWNYLWTFLSEINTAPGPAGTQVQRSLGNSADSSQTNNLGSEPAWAPANNFNAGSGPTGGPAERLHAQPYGAAVTNSGAADCESGQRGYINRAPNAPPGFNTAADSHNSVGYRAGPTYAYFDKNNNPVGLGPDRVPAGETFTREPGGIGYTLDPNQLGSP